MLKKVLYYYCFIYDTVVLGTIVNSRFLFTKEAFMKNIRFVLLGQLILLILVFAILIFGSNFGISAALWFVDLPSLILIMLILIPGLIIMGEWKDFLKAFSVGIKKFRLLELKNIIDAVSAAQKLTVFGALFAIIISVIIILGQLNDLEALGANLAVCMMAGLYAVIIEFFLLPLRLNAERRMNEEMDLEDE
jgi:flagellar motor component MotA